METNKNLMMSSKKTCFNLPTIAGVYRARKSISTIIESTPLAHNLRLSQQLNAQVFLKREDLQPVRSYKIRGAYHKIYSLSKEEKSKGIICASAGNHAQGVAYSCKQLGIKGVIFMPTTTPVQKIEQVQMFGDKFIDIRIQGDTFDDCKSIALSEAEGKNIPFIHPFDDIDIIEGQATVALEILASFNGKIDYLFLPVGGGGLAAGIATVFSTLSPDTKIIGVEPTGAASMALSLRNGFNTSLRTIDTFVDGAAVKRVGELTFEICRQHLETCIAIEEGMICDTLLELYNKDAIVVEPAGALSICGLKRFRDEVKNKNVVCIISGSNNDITRMEEIKERALVYKRLKHYFIVKFPQRPGALKEFVLHVLSKNDDITYFEYTKKNSRETALAIVGIEVKHQDDFILLSKRMKDQGYFERYLNDTPMMMGLLV